MTVDEVKRRVQAIQGMTGDPEVAHSEEDALWADVLAAIAAGAENPQELAAAALETISIEYPRWYA